MSSIDLIRTVLLLTGLLAIGILTTITDIKNGKIKNKLLLFGLVFGILLNISVLNLNLILNYFINLVFSAFIGFLLWHIRFWNAGDGKLFTVLVALFPITLFFKSTFNLYAYSLILYTFIPIFFVFLVLILFKIRIQDLKKVKEYSDFRTIIMIMLTFFSFQWITTLFVRFTNIPLNMFLSVLVLFFVFNSLEKTLNVDMRHIVFLIVILRIILDFNLIFSIPFFLDFLFNFVVFIFIVYFVLHLAYFQFSTHVKLSDLKPGMNLCELIIEKNGKYTVMPYVMISLFAFLRVRTKLKPLIELRPAGLTVNDINLLKKMFGEKKLNIGSFLIQKRVPFAPFIFFGTILLIVLKLLNINLF